MHKLFENELAALARFTEILQQEQSALVNADVDRLIGISREKSAQAEVLNQLARERISALQAQGAGSSRDDVEAWLKKQPEVVVRNWNALIAAAAAAQQLNQINGKLIDNQLQQTQQALNVLSTAANQSAVYGADGQTRGLHPSSQRILGKG